MSAGRFAGRVALVTGAGAGIGRAVALRLAAEGARVVATDLDAAKAAETAGLAGAGASHHTLDVCDEAQVGRVYAEVAKREGRLDVQVSHAGITDRIDFLDMTQAQLDRIVRTNLNGTVLCGQAAARLMIASGGGRIVNTTSVSGLQGGTGRSAYGASKAAIVNLTQVMAMELARHGITVNAVAPGPTQVERTRHGEAQRAAFLDRMAIKRYAKPEEIAAAVLFLASEDASFVTGQVLAVDGGFSAAGVLYEPKGES